MIAGLLIALIKIDQKLFFLLIIPFNNLLSKKKFPIYNWISGYPDIATFI